MALKKILAEIITIGDEILYGQITDTNSQWISEELDKAGIKTIRKSSVGDDDTEILQLISEAEARADILLITGGLGPTNDDITKKVLAKYFNCSLVLNENALWAVTEFFKTRGKELTEINKTQAYLPEKCNYIRNQWGTAPGMWFDFNGKVLVSMPGVPHEMKGLMKEEIIPALKKKFNCPVIFHKVIKTTGIGESYLADKIKDWENNLPSEMKLAYLPSFDGVKLRLTSFGNDLTALQSKTDEEVVKLNSLIEEYVVGYDQDTLPQVIGKLLSDRKMTVSLAESCTGGYTSHLITTVPGSSSYFMGSLVAYDNRIKEEILGVKKETLTKFGAVSEETVKEMAEGIRKKFNTTIGLSSSGIAGPGGGTPEKPVGTIYIGYSDGVNTIVKKLTLGKDREINIKMTGTALLNLLRKGILYPTKA